MHTKTKLAIVLSAIATSTIHAQGRAEEPEAGAVDEVPALTLEGARQVLHLALAAANARKTTGAVAIVDAGGQLLALERLDGTFAAAAEVATGKARTAAQFNKPTSFFEEVINKGRTAMTTLPGFTPLAGGVPLRVRGVLVGAIGVSGAASAKEDEELATAAAKAFEMQNTTTQVDFIDGQTVRSAFTEGAALRENGRFKVHASHRAAAGVAELHERDTDILYFLSGSATLVTGGEMVAPKPMGPGELRGSGIKGGQTRKVEPGDIVIIPGGVPHWFRSVSGGLDYYTVKVN